VRERTGGCSSVGSSIKCLAEILYATCIVCYNLDIVLVVL
jgi:hypothetical protein